MFILMNYTSFISTSFHVFIACFFIGTFVDTVFKHLTLQHFNHTSGELSPKHRAILLILAMVQLFTIISLTYLLHTYKFFGTVLETYTPHVLFSTFLLSLQNTMLYNIRRAFHISYIKI